jgi:hypothetical protein
MLAPGGIEPTTFALLARRSNQLSYGASCYVFESTGTSCNIILYNYYTFISIIKY